MPTTNPTRARPLGRRPLRVALALIACYALVIAGVVGCRLADRLLLYPPGGAVDPGGATRLALPTTDGELEVFRARSRKGPQEPEAYVLRFYGNADRADRWAAEEAASLPFDGELWGVNYPGFGGSAGHASLRGVADAALRSFDALAARAGGKPIIVRGTSMGTAAALHVAAEREVAGVILQNPPPLRQLIVGDHGWWNLWLLAFPVSWQIPPELDSLANARRARAPAVFLLAESDEVVRPRYQLAIRDAYAGPKRSFVLAGAHHNDPVPAETLGAVDREMLAWLREAQAKSGHAP